MSDQTTLFPDQHICTISLDEIKKTSAPKEKETVIDSDLIDTRVFVKKTTRVYNQAFIPKFNFGDGNTYKRVTGKIRVPDFEKYAKRVININKNQPQPVKGCDNEPVLTVIEHPIADFLFEQVKKPPNTAIYYLTKNDLLSIYNEK
jgi:hypothetical protein